MNKRLTSINILILGSKSIRLILLFLIILLPYNTVQAIHTQSNQVDVTDYTDSLADEMKVTLNTGYKIQAFDIDISVDNKKVLDITETITAQFYEPKHGIIRYIPLQGSTVSNVRIKDADTGKFIPFQNDIDKDNLVLKIGDRNKKTTGNKTYVIHYQYACNKKKIPLIDNLSIDLIGTGWDTYIHNITFHITMPEEFSPSNLQFAINHVESNDQERIQYKTSTDSIVGSVLSLAPSEGLVFQLSLPKGYFNRSLPLVEYVLFFVFISSILIGILLFFIFGINDNIHVKSNCSIPQDMTPADIGYVLGKKARIRGIIALIPYWANQGYLTMTPIDNNSIILTKKKETDEGMKPYEIIMFLRLFHDGNEVNTQNLKNLLASVIKEVNEKLHESFQVNESEVYTKGRYISKFWCYRLAGICAGIASGRFLFRELVVTPYSTSFIIFIIFNLIAVIIYAKGSNGMERFLARFKDAGVGAIILFFGGMLFLAISMIGLSGFLHITIVQQLKIIGAITISELITLVFSYIIPQTVNEVEQGKQWYKQQILQIYLYLSFIVFIFILVLLKGDEIGSLGILVTVVCVLLGRFSQKRTAQGNQWVSEILGLKRFFIVLLTVR